MQIELIRQRNNVPSIYTEFAARDSGGLQHMGVITESVERDLARLSLEGIEPVQYGTTAAGMRFAYVPTDRHPGAMIELIQPNERTQRFFDKMHRAAEQWGRNRPDSADRLSPSRAAASKARTVCSGGSFIAEHNS